MLRWLHAARKAAGWRRPDAQALIRDLAPRPPRPSEGMLTFPDVPRTEPPRGEAHCLAIRATRLPMYIALANCKSMVPLRPDEPRRPRGLMNASGTIC
jgi:hypothetical protein